MNPSDEPLRRLDGNVRGIVAVLSGVALSPLGVPPSLIEEAVYLGSSLLARQVNDFPLCGRCLMAPQGVYVPYLDPSG